MFLKMERKKEKIIGALTGNARARDHAGSTGFLARSASIHP